MNVIGKKATWLETSKQTFQMSQFSGSRTSPLCPVGTFRNCSKTRHWLVQRLDAHQWRSWCERDRRRVLQVLDEKTSRFRLWCVLWDLGMVRFWTLQIEANWWKNCKSIKRFLLHERSLSFVLLTQWILGPSTLIFRNRCNQWRSQPKNLGGAKMLGFRWIALLFGKTPLKAQNDYIF